jgi:hypothetical protein
MLFGIHWLTAQLLASLFSALISSNIAFQGAKYEIQAFRLYSYGRVTSGLFSGSDVEF